MAANTLSILKPSVNNLTARIFVRAAGLDFEEVDVWGKKGTPEFLAKDPADLTPLLEEAGLPRGSLWESCAIMQYLCNKHGLDRLLPDRPGARAMVDSAMFYLIGTLYPLIARATYPRSASRSTRARSAPPTPTTSSKAQAQRDATAALARAARGVPGRSSSTAKPFIGGDRRRSPTSGSPPRSSSCTRSTTSFPAWASEYMSAIESTLGDAYSEPAADVRGFIASVKSPVT